MATSTRRDNGRYYEDAPTQYLAFPHNEPITAVELLVLDPNKIRSYDTNFRLHSNGVTNQVVETIVNYHRDEMAKGGVEANNLLKVMQKTMRARQIHFYPIMKKIDGEMEQVDELWTSKSHKKFNTKDHYGPWNPNNLECTGYSPDLGNQNLVPNVRFDSLAKDMKRYPSIVRGDGLNLTRCVQYAAAHPGEDLMYPRDFTALTDKLGRLPVQPQHFDAAVFDRYKNRRTPNPPARLIPSSRAAIALRNTAAPVAPAVIAQAPPAQSGASQLPPIQFWPPPQVNPRQGAPTTTLDSTAGAQSTPSRRARSRPSTGPAAVSTLSRPKNSGVKKHTKSRANVARPDDDARVAQLQRNPTQFAGSVADLDFLGYIPGHDDTLLDQQFQPALGLFNPTPQVDSYSHPGYYQPFVPAPIYHAYGDTTMGDEMIDPALPGDYGGFMTPTPSEINQFFDDRESGFSQSSPYANNDWVPTGTQVAFPPLSPVGAFWNVPDSVPLEQYEWDPSYPPQPQLDLSYEQGVSEDYFYEDPALAYDERGAYFPSNFQY
jgi:hypothetical protein